MTKEKDNQFHNSTVYIGSFDSLEDFLFYVRDENVNSMFANIMSSKNGSYNFTGTNSYQEAWNLCRYTMNNGFSQFLEKFDFLNYYIDTQYKIENNYSVSGFAPSIPRYLLNIPTSMYYHVTKDIPTVNIYMNYAYSASVSKKAVEHRGIIVLNLIQHLEKSGYKVNFFGFDLSHSRFYSELLFMEVPLKKEYEQLNLKTLYFPLVHPSFFRRLLFRATEKMPLTLKEWVDGYGFPSNYQESVEFLEYYKKLKHAGQVIYISSPYELGIKGDDLRKDFNEVISKLNSQCLDIGNQKIKR